MPLDIGYGIADVLCDEVKNTSIPKRLEELEIPFEWTNQEEGFLTVGPITEEKESGSVYSTIRPTYSLEVGRMGRNHRCCNHRTVRNAVSRES